MQQTEAQHLRQIHRVGSSCASKFAVGTIPLKRALLPAIPLPFPLLLLLLLLWLDKISPGAQPTPCTARATRSNRLRSQWKREGSHGPSSKRICFAGISLLKRRLLSTVWTLVGIQPSTFCSAPMLEFDWIASTMHPTKPTAMALAAPCAVSMVISGTGSLPTNLRALEVHHSVSPKTPEKACVLGYSWKGLQYRHLMLWI